MSSSNVWVRRRLNKSWKLSISSIIMNSFWLKLIRYWEEWRWSKMFSRISIVKSEFRRCSSKFFLLFDLTSTRKFFCFIHEIFTMQKRLFVEKLSNLWHLFRHWYNSWISLTENSVIVRMTVIKSLIFFSERLLIKFWKSILRYYWWTVSTKLIVTKC